MWACSTYIDKGKKVCRGIRIPECVTDEWTIDEPVVVREEVNADGEKYYSYSGQQESDGRNSGKERNTKSEWQRIAGCLQTKKNSYQVMRTRSVII